MSNDHNELAELVDALRRPDRWDAHFYQHGFGTASHSDLPSRAAAAIEQLISENHTLTVDVRRLGEEESNDARVIMSHAAKIRELRAEIDRINSEQHP